MAKEPAGAAFYSDMMYEILSRTPMKSLDRFKTVSKEINNLVQEPSFVPLHGSRTGTITGYFIQNKEPCKNWSEFVSGDDSSPEEDRNKISLDFLPCPMKILASSNQGIMCCIGQDMGKFDKFYVCKPSTRQWQVMPSPKMRYFTRKVAIVVLKSRPLRYSIVRISEGGPKMTYHNNYHCEVFDSDTWTWRETNQILLPSMVFFNNEPGVVSSVASGLVHWLLSDYQILTFHLDRDLYEIFNPPLAIIFDIDGYFKNKQISACKGKLKFFCQDPEGYLLMWEMKSHKRREWGKMEKLYMGPLEGGAIFTGPAVYDEDTALLTGFCRISFFNFQDGKCREVKMPKHTYRAEIFPFRSDKEPVQLSRLKT